MKVFQSPISSRPPLTTQTRLFGHLSNATELRQLGGIVEYVNMQLDRYSLDCLYIPLQVSPENLNQAIDGLLALRYFKGFTVTMPHKSEAAKICHTLLPNAFASSSVNAIRVEEDGTLTGESFDGLGILKAIESRRKLTSQTSILIYGAGGVGQAIAVALALAHIAKVDIVNRTHSKAILAAQKANSVSSFTKISAVEQFNLVDYDIIIQATSLGSGNGEGKIPLNLNTANNGCLIVEAVRTPEMTNLLLEASSLNLEFVGGNEMLLPQIDSIIHFLGMM